MSAAATTRLKDEIYLNWLRGSLGLLFLKESLEDFVDKRVLDFHNDLHKTVPQPYSRLGPVNTAQSQQQTSSCVQICKSCSNNEIQRHHGTWRVRCSSGVCCEWLKHIIRAHVHQPCPNIACANLKPQLWPSHPWEVAKCFLPDGSESVIAAKDTDVAAMLKLLNTCLFMHQFFKDHSLVEEILKIRHRLMHSNTLTVSDDQLKSDTDKMIQLLRSLDDLSPTETQTVQTTIDKINKLQSKTMDMTVHRELIAFKSRIQDVDRELIRLHDKCNDCEKSRLDMNKTAADLKSLDEEYRRTKSDILQLTSSRDKFQEFLVKNNLVKDIDRLAVTLKEHEQWFENHNQRMDSQDTRMDSQDTRMDSQYTRMDSQDTRMDSQDTRIDDQDRRMDALEEMSKADVPVACSSRSWEDQCKDLQTLLVRHYKRTCLEVPNPAETNDIGLEYIYVNPEIRILRQSKGRDGLKNVKDEASSISCRKIFYNDEYPSRQIYITGDAGSGKSLLCKNIVRRWCEAHGELLSNEALDSDSDSDEEAQWRYSLDPVEQRRQARTQRQQERKARREDDRQILSQFMFLFYITLRDSLSEYNVNEMIQSQILQYYNTGKDLCSPVVLRNENKRCLVIVDGLDEWVCPAGAPVPHFSNPGLPGRDISNENNVFLTTTRPWKLDILDLRSSEVDKHIELCELNEKSSSQICSKVIKLLNKSQSCRKKKREFFETLKQKGLGHFKTTPVILIQLIFLWFDNQQLDKSQVQLYCAMLDLLLKKSQKNLSVQTSNTLTSLASDTHLPKCIIEHPYCQDHQQLIYCLSRVAFEALFDKTKENSLLFKSSQLEIYGVGQESIDLCLKSGILSQNKGLEKCSVSEKKLSFLHKKFQEFLAAIFLVSCDNVQDVIKHITDFCSTLDTCLEMSQVWLFVSGIRPDITRQLLDHLTRVVTTDQKVKHYRQTLHGEGLIRAIQTCVTDCVIEGGNNGHIYDNIMLEDFYIDSNTACHVERLLSCTPRSKVKSVYIDTLIGDIGDSQLRSITSQLEQCHSVQKLHLVDPWSSRIDSDTVAQIVNNNLDTLTCLHLDSRITATAELVSDICSISSKCLMALRLWTVRLTHEHIEQILTRLPQSPTIRQLDLWLHCTDHGLLCQTGRIDLSTMTHIQRLVLYYMSVDNLQSVSHCVEHVALGWVILPVTTLCEFARRLSQTRRDVTVKLYHVTVTEVRERRVDVETLYQRVVTVTEVRERRVDVKTFLRTCHGLKVTYCQYNSYNTWSIHFTTSSQ